MIVNGRELYTFKATAELGWAVTVAATVIAGYAATESVAAAALAGAGARPVLATLKNATAMALSRPETPN